MLSYPPHYFFNHLIHFSNFDNFILFLHWYPLVCFVEVLGIEHKALYMLASALPWVPHPLPDTLHLQSMLFTAWEPETDKTQGFTKHTTKSFLTFQCSDMYLKSQLFKKSRQEDHLNLRVSSQAGLGNTVRPCLWKYIYFLIKWCSTIYQKY